MPRKRTLWDFSTHPLLLLFIGSVIGSFLIPIVSEKIGKKRVLQEARVKKAAEIVDNNIKTLSQINSLITRLNMFHDDNTRLKPSPAQLSEQQEKLRDDMNGRYLEFEKTGWWWYRNLNDEAVILEIVPPSGSQKLRDDINAYAQNINDTVSAFGDFWHICLSKDYKVEKDGKVSQIKKEMDTKLNSLFNARIALVNNLVQDFKDSQ